MRDLLTPHGVDKQLLYTPSFLYNSRMETKCECQVCIILSKCYFKKRACGLFSHLDQDWQQNPQNNRQIIHVADIFRPIYEKEYKRMREKATSFCIFLAGRPNQTGRG